MHIKCDDIQHAGFVFSFSPAIKCELKMWIMETVMLKKRTANTTVPPRNADAVETYAVDKHPAHIMFMACITFFNKSELYCLYF